LKDGGTLIAPTLARAGELAVQAHTLDRCGVEESLLDSADPHLHHWFTESFRDGKMHPFDGDIVQPRLR
jgi:hypothetical protein